MLGKRRLTVATVAVVAGAGWAVFIAPSSDVAAAPAAGRTVRASVGGQNPNDQAPDGGNQSRISGNGRFDVFVSRDDLDPNIETNDFTQEVFVRDLDNNVTTQISVANDGEGLTGVGANRDVSDPSISTDGRYVSFHTFSSNVAPRPDDNVQDHIFVCDRDPDGNGVFDEPVSATNPQADIDCVFIADPSTSLTSPPMLSGRGSILIWGISGNHDNTFNTVDVAPVLDGSGRVTMPDPDNISELSNDLPTLGTADIFGAVISADGHHVVYSALNGFGEGTTGIFDTTLDDNGAPTGTERRDTNSDNVSGHWVGSQELVVHDPATSADGRVIAYDVDASAGSTAPWVDVSQPFHTTIEITGKPSDTPSSFAIGDGIDPAVSADGRYIAYVTDEADAVDAAPPTGSPPNRTCIKRGGGGITDNNIPCQVVVRDYVKYQDQFFGPDPMTFAELASVSIKADCGEGSPVCAGDFDSTSPSLTEHGGKVAFDAFADDLITGDTNVFCDSYCEESNGIGDPVEDAFVRTWTRSLKLPNKDVGSVHVGAGKTIKYVVKATGFGGQVVSGADLTALQGDGISVDDTGCGGGSSPDAPLVLNKGETCTITLIFAPTTEGPISASLTVHTNGDDPNPATISGTGLPPLPTNTRDIVRTSVGDGDPGTQGDQGTQCHRDFINELNLGNCQGSSMVSGDGHWDVFVSRDPLDGQSTRGVSNIFVRDLTNNLTHRITWGESRIGRGPFAPNGDFADGDSTEPTISADGRFVLFETSATNMVGNFGEDRTIVVLCDRDPNDDGVFDELQPNSSPDYRCFPVHNESSLDFDPNPRISADGTHLVFVACNQPTESGCRDTEGAYEVIDLARIVTQPGGTVINLADQTQLSEDFTFNEGGPFVERYQPQVSDEGLFGIAHGVRVAYAATYPDFSGQGKRVVSGIFTADVRDPNSVATHRVDRAPGGGGLVGDSDGLNQSRQVGNPSLTNDGSEVAFDFTDSFAGFARAFVVTLSGKGTASGSRFVSVTNGGNPVRAADPALSGDGRYVSYVTDSPNFGSGGSGTLSESCLINNSDLAANAKKIPAGSGYTPCQIVARDLVLDKQRAANGQSRLPDALVTEGLDQNCGSPATVFGFTCGGDNDSVDPSMSETGQKVGFDSFADDLVPKDTNPVGTADSSGLDAFVRTFFPQAVLSPVTFGSVPVGSSSDQMGTVIVTGFGPYVLADATVGGADPGDFSVTGATCALPGQVLHFGESCELTLTFTPQANGPRSGTITVSGEDNPRTTTVNITGTGGDLNTNLPAFSVDPNPLDFGTGLPLDKPGDTRVVKVTNGGKAALVISSVDVIDSSVPGAFRDYSVDLSSCGSGVIGAGTSCKVKVTWIGRAVGARPAILRFVDNAAGGMHMVVLQANVRKPKIEITPDVVPTGRLTQVAGRGFAPKHDVVIKLADSGEQATGRTDKHGRFSIPLIVFPNGILGHRSVQAHSAHADKSIKAVQPVLVVLGTLQSPTLVIRH